MRMITLLIVIILVLLASSVDAQKRKPQPPVARGTYIIQDDGGEGAFTFDVATGVFRCVRCEDGYEWRGVGTAKCEGGNVTFNCDTEEYEIFVSIDVFTNQGKVLMEFYESGPKGKMESKLRFSDGNIKDSTMTCNTK